MNKIIRILDHSRESETTAPMGVLGELYVDDEFQCYTMEQAWRDNQRYVSCVPAGEYNLTPYTSRKYGSVVALVGKGVVAYESEAKESDRFACLFHSANWSSQLQGCIAPGNNISWGTRNGHVPNLMVTSSRTVLAELLPMIIDKPLLIEWRHV